MKATDCDIYVGFSSGAFIAAALANGISSSEMHAIFILDWSHGDPFEPELLLCPAFGEFAHRLMQLPELVQSAAWAYFTPALTRGFVESCSRLTHGLPNGLFGNAPIAEYLERLVLFAPSRDDPVMFFANVYRYAERRELAEHAYRHTLAELRRRASELAPILRRRGVEVDHAALDAPPIPKESSEGGGWARIEPLDDALLQLKRALNGNQAISAE